MKLSKANLLVSRVAASGTGGDENLKQVHVEPDGSTVSSDGHAVMAVGPVPPEAGSMMPEFEDEVESVGGDGVGLPIKVVNEAMRRMPRGDIGRGLGFAVITQCDIETGSSQAVELTTTDMDMEYKAKARRARKRFPEYKGILRKAKRDAVGMGVRIAVDRRALAGLLQAIDSACPNPENAVFLEFGEDGFLLRAVNLETGQHVIGHMRPLYTGGKWLPMDDWERKVCGRTRKAKKKTGVEKEQEDGRKEEAGEAGENRKRRISRTPKAQKAGAKTRSRKRPG